MRTQSRTVPARLTALRTLVVSDLHLGGRPGDALLERPEALAALLARLAEVDRLVLLGDVLELRFGPPAEVLRRAGSILRRIGEAVPTVVLVPGNHDHGLAAEVLDRARRDGRGLGIEQVVRPAGGGLAAAVCGRLGERATLAYPGLWLAPGVYATHGHYLDVHATTPGVETIAAGTLSRLLGGSLRTPGDYERTLRPIYAFNAARARLLPRLATPPPAPPRGRSVGGRRPSPWLRRLAAVGTAAGAGPYRFGLGAGDRRRAHADAMAEALGRLGVNADHVVFGHTHLAGTVETARATLLNCGSWTGRQRAGPAALVEDGAPPRLIELGESGR